MAAFGLPNPWCPRLNTSAPSGPCEEPTLDQMLAHTSGMWDSARWAGGRMAGAAPRLAPQLAAGLAALARPRAAPARSPRGLPRTRGSLGCHVCIIGSTRTLPPALPPSCSCMLNPESTPAYQLPYCFANRLVNYTGIMREVAGGPHLGGRWREARRLGWQEGRSSRGGVVAGARGRAPAAASGPAAWQAPQRVPVGRVPCAGPQGARSGPELPCSWHGLHGSTPPAPPSRLPDLAQASPPPCGSWPTGRSASRSSPSRGSATPTPTTATTSWATLWSG